MQHFWNVYKNFNCVVPENIHTPTTEGTGNSEKKGPQKAKIFKGKYEPKLAFPEGWGVQTKKTLHGYFLEQHKVFF